ncbi:hypothetical protein J6590_019269 [Homalodisca vitripennis]|nr:hypothetical protein J6590_019269 [Homalodisca vitripennis]
MAAHLALAHGAPGRRGAHFGKLCLRRMTLGGFPHSPYSPDLAPSDYRLFPAIKTWFATQSFDVDMELREGLPTLLKFRQQNFVTLEFRYDSP